MGAEVTAFFDDMSVKISAASVSWDTMKALEEALVFPCLRASTVPGFNPLVASAIDAAILQFGVTTLPPNAPPADFETDDEHRQRLLELEAALHGAFHAAGGVEGGSDSPLLWLDRATLYVAQGRLEAAAGGVPPTTPAPEGDLVKPTLHLNGSGASSLMDGYTAAAQALRAAVDALACTAPNGRDYYPQGPEAIGKATAQHMDRIRRLQEVQSELVAIRRHAQGARRG
jgi:hypothetical protein